MAPRGCAFWIEGRKAIVTAAEFHQLSPALEAGRGECGTGRARWAGGEEEHTREGGDGEQER